MWKSIRFSARNCFEGSSPGILNLRKLRKSFLNIRSGCGKTKESGELCSSWDLEDHDILLKLLEIMNEALGEKNYGYFSLEKNKIFFVVEETPEIKKLLGNAFEQITELGKDGTVATSVSCYYEK